MNRTPFAMSMAAPAGSLRACAWVPVGTWQHVADMGAYSTNHIKSSKRTTRKAFRHST